MENTFIKDLKVALALAVMLMVTPLLSASEYEYRLPLGSLTSPSQSLTTETVVEAEEVPEAAPVLPTYTYALSFSGWGGMFTQPSVANAYLYEK